VGSSVGSPAHVIMCTWMGARLNRFGGSLPVLSRPRLAVVLVPFLSRTNQPSSFVQSEKKAATTNQQADDASEPHVTRLRRRRQPLHRARATPRGMPLPPEQPVTQHPDHPPGVRSPEPDVKLTTGENPRRQQPQRSDNPQRDEDGDRRQWISQPGRQRGNRARHASERNPPNSRHSGPFVHGSTRTHVLDVPAQHAAQRELP
jgi:hypothetical protein